MSSSLPATWASYHPAWSPTGADLAGGSFGRLSATFPAAAPPQGVRSASPAPMRFVTSSAAGAAGGLASPPRPGAAPPTPLLGGLHRVITSPPVPAPTTWRVASSPRPSVALRSSSPVPEGSVASQSILAGADRPENSPRRRLCRMDSFTSVARTGSPIASPTAGGMAVTRFSSGGAVATSVPVPTTAVSGRRPSKNIQGLGSMGGVVQVATTAGATSPPMPPPSPVHLVPVPVPIEGRPSVAAAPPQHVRSTVPRQAPQGQVVPVRYQTPLRQSVQRPAASAVGGIRPVQPVLTQARRSELPPKEQAAAAPAVLLSPPPSVVAPALVQGQGAVTRSGHPGTPTLTGSTKAVTIPQDTAGMRFKPVLSREGEVAPGAAGVKSRVGGAPVVALSQQGTSRGAIVGTSVTGAKDVGALMSPLIQGEAALTPLEAEKTSKFQF
eukprot:TRINITY_DN38126_c0_g1_i2.p1 TRINITY_DN38126_c0_g1~~TRINITY_DN38126_c0_g1_i2.p1  ORF type:complete len:440 (+),score=58.49 TRINITY_DN38126_c0_g1_i2:120-1439(+)